MSAPPAGLTASLCHRSYCSFLAAPCFLSQDYFLSLSLGNRLHVLAGVPPCLSSNAGSTRDFCWAAQLGSASQLAKRTPPSNAAGIGRLRWRRDPSAWCCRNLGCSSLTTVLGADPTFPHALATPVHNYVCDWLG